MSVLRVFSFALVTCSACSLLTSVDGLSGGAIDVGETNAESGSTGAGVTETSTDASLVDAATGDASDASGPFCASLSPQPTFCVDFDETPLSFDWSAQLGGEGSFELDEAIFVSPGHSARAVLREVDCDGPVLQRNWNTPTSELHFASMIRPGFEDGGTNGESTIAYFFMAAAESSLVSCSFSVVQSEGSIGIGVTKQFVDGQGAGGFEFGTRFPQNGKWSLLAVDIVGNTDGNPIVSARLDDVEIIAPWTLTDCHVGGETYFGIGVQCTKDTPVEMHFDDLRVDLK